MEGKRTCSHRALPCQSQQSFFLEDETASDEDAGADGQRQADAEVVPASVLAHAEAGCVVVLCHIYQLTIQQLLTKNTAVRAGPGTYKDRGTGNQQIVSMRAAQNQNQPRDKVLPSTHVILWVRKP